MAQISGVTQAPAAAPVPVVSLFAGPAPLGLAGFGFTTLLLSVINTGIIPSTSVPVVLALALPFGGACQFIAGLVAFRNGNHFAATAFCSYGAFWFSFVFLFTLFGTTLPKDPTPILGLYAMAWALFTAYMTIASLAGTKAVTVVFVLLTLTFIALGIGFWGHDAMGKGFTQIGGILGLATAAAAIYTSFADVTNAVFKRTVIPV
jgi:succinate-acetate transporter protein